MRIPVHGIVCGNCRVATPVFREWVRDGNARVFGLGIQKPSFRNPAAKPSASQTPRLTCGATEGLMSAEDEGSGSGIPKR